MSKLIKAESKTDTMEGCVISRMEGWVISRMEGWVISREDSSGEVTYLTRYKTFSEKHSNAYLFRGMPEFPVSVGNKYRIHPAKLITTATLSIYEA